MKSRIELVVASLLLAGCAAPDALGTSAEAPMGRDTTAVVGAYSRLVNMAVARYRDDLPIAYAGVSGTFVAATNDDDPHVDDLVLVLNGLPQGPREAIGDRWATIHASADALFHALRGADEAMVTYADAAGSWLTEPVSGKVYRAPVNRVAWTSPGSEGCESVAGPLRGIVGALAGVTEDGAPDVAIDLSACHEDGAGRYWVTHDPPSDGTTPTSVQPSIGSGGILVTGAPATGCMPANSTIGVPCLLAHATSAFPNYVPNATTDSHGTVWLAFTIQGGQICPGPSDRACLVK
jgi:hypothetical protein